MIFIPLRPLAATVVAFTVAVGAASCGGGGVSTKSGRAGTLCRGAAKPVSVDAAEEVLQDAGFSVERVRVSLCQGDTPDQDIVAELSNRGTSSYDRVKEEEGNVTCAIYRGPIYDGFNRDLREAPASPIFSGRKASWWFANVECDIYPSERNADEQIAKLDKAMETLARRDRVGMQLQRCGCRGCFYKSQADLGIASSIRKRERAT